MNIFEQASKEKLRFATESGNLSVEDLWDLPITSQKKLNLKNIATNLQSIIKESPANALDFLETASTVDPIVQLKFDIVKHIVIVKQTEAKEKSAAKVTETHNAELKELIKLKKQEQLAGKSIEELEALLK